MLKNGQKNGTKGISNHVRQDTHGHIQTLTDRQLADLILAPAVNSLCETITKVEDSPIISEGDYRGKSSMNLF